jgi:hypothetical protein
MRRTACRRALGALILGVMMAGTGCVVRSTSTREDTGPGGEPEKHQEVEVKPAVPHFHED